MRPVSSDEGHHARCIGHRILFLCNQTLLNNKLDISILVITYYTPAETNCKDLLQVFTEIMSEKITRVRIASGIK